VQGARLSTIGKLLQYRSARTASASNDGQVQDMLRLKRHVGHIMAPGMKQRISIRASPSVQS
jgi:hypothetical protein